MNVARSSSYYRRRGRRRSDEDQLVTAVSAICDRFPGYGYRRVTRQLVRDGWTINHKRVARVMAEHGLQPTLTRRFVMTSDGAAQPPYPNLARDFTPTAANQLWVGDITYLWVGGFAYLAVLLDAWSRRVVGYAVSRHMGVQLTIAALRAAIVSRDPGPGCIHHTDRGSQYSANAYRALLEQRGLRGSMSRRGNPYDNAQAESFMKTLNDLPPRNRTPDLSRNMIRNEVLDDQTETAAIYRGVQTGGGSAGHRPGLLVWRSGAELRGAWRFDLALEAPIRGR